jgi:hypothetical protein
VYDDVFADLAVHRKARRVLTLTSLLTEV